MHCLPPAATCRWCTADCEIIVLLGGIDESTSRTMEARQSYLPADIRWQHQFNPVIQRRCVWIDVRGCVRRVGEGLNWVGAC